MKKILTVGITLCLLIIVCSCEEERQPSAPIKKDKNQISQDSAKAIYRQFFFSGTHNSYSGNLDGMQREGIKTQLERGLRFFEFDLFSYYTQNKLQKEWPEEIDKSIVFDYMGQTHLLTYTKADGIIKIYKLSTDEPEMVYENTDAPFAEGDRSFSVLSFETELYFFSYDPNSGELTIYRFDNNTLSSVHSENIGSSAATISTFLYNDNAYLAVHKSEASTYGIYALSLADNEVSLGDILYELTSVPSDEILCPFVQDNNLYIFQHNINNITNFTVETLNTEGNTWSTEASVRGRSDLLKGTVQASHTNGKLYVNAYAANGNVTGAQLVMDNEKPNLVFEYSNEIDMIAGADAHIYPSSKGYYLLLQKGSNVQLSLITIGVLTLGHDAPGDEVDLDVDNPSSIFLADWIAYIANWSNEHPYHEPLFIMTELKEYEQWIADAKWQNIIRLMQENFGDKLRYHSSSGFHQEPIVDQTKIVDGETLYFMDENGSKEGGLLGKVILYIQPNNNITKGDYTNNFEPFETTNGELQENFLQLRRYRENNKLVSPDWRKPGSYGNDLGDYIDNKDNSYISRIFHMESADGNGQYDNIRCTNVMFGVSDRPFDQGPYADYVVQQKVKNELENVDGCE